MWFGFVSHAFQTNFLIPTVHIYKYVCINMDWLTITLYGKNNFFTGYWTKPILFDRMSHQFKKKNYFEIFAFKVSKKVKVGA